MRQVLTRTGLSPSSLMLELTETVLLRRDERLLADLIELKSIGSSWPSTTSAPATRPCPTCASCPSTSSRSTSRSWTASPCPEQGLALVEGIIGIARTLHLDVIAEGIETEVQRDLLVSMSCQYDQGYLLAMPVAADQAETLVRLGHGSVPELPRVSP